MYKKRRDKQYRNITGTYNIIEGRVSKHGKLTKQCVPGKHLIFKDMKATIKEMVKLKCIEIIRESKLISCSCG